MVTKQGPAEPIVGLIKESVHTMINCRTLTETMKYWVGPDAVKKDWLLAKHRQQY